MIQLIQVRKVYGARRQVAALDGIDLEIGPGAMAAIMGPSGSGKSTLLNLLGGLDRPTTGKVLLEGVDLAGLDEEERTRIRRDKIGIVFQFFNLLPSLSAAENVQLPLLLAGKGGAAAERGAREALGLVALEGRADHLPDALSGGERQRVAIARAVVTRPALLLADEPTGNLDSATGEDVMAVLRDVHARLGTTVIIVTHDERIAAVCQTVIHLRDGRIESIDGATPSRPGPEAPSP